MMTYKRHRFPDRSHRPGIVNTHSPHPNPDQPMTIPIYQVDAFTLGPFSGNPAAVCPLDAWFDDVSMQNIAAENNLAETAFIVPREDGYDLRWFTPTVEVDLCGDRLRPLRF